MVVVSTSSQKPEAATAGPQRILTTLQAYRDAAALNTAIELDLFTRIAHGTDTAGKIAGEMGIPARGVRLLCDYLASIGLLSKEEDEQLKLPPDALRFLDRTSGEYVGDAARLVYSPALLHAFERLTDSVKAGKPPKVDDAGLKGNPEWFDVARGVLDRGAAAHAFAQALNFPTGTPLKIMDFAAGDGTFGIALARRFSDAVVVAVDCAEALKTAQANADAAKLGTRYQNIPGEPFLASLGMEYDAVVTAGSLHRFEASQITSLLMRLYYALKKGGRLILLEFLAESEAAASTEATGFRLNVLAATSRGDAYSLAQVKDMIESSGFSDVEAQAFPEARAMLVTAQS